MHIANNLDQKLFFSVYSTRNFLLMYEIRIKSLFISILQTGYVRNISITKGMKHQMKTLAIYPPVFGKFPSLLLFLFSTRSCHKEGIHLQTAFPHLQVLFSDVILVKKTRLKVAEALSHKIT